MIDLMMFTENRISKYEESSVSCLTVLLKSQLKSKQTFGINSKNKNFKKIESHKFKKKYNKIIKNEFISHDIRLTKKL